MTAQPLFDRDGDGYAGELGGGDCDDSDPDVHPGAAEIPVMPSMMTALGGIVLVDANGKKFVLSRRSQRRVAG